MSGLHVEFRGMCLASVIGKKVAYNKFITEPEIGMPPSEFQVSCPDAVQPESLWKLADWKLDGFEAVQGSKDGRQYAFFRCSKMAGKPITDKK